MLQIVIYKKLNFWEEYTPLPLGKVLRLRWTASMFQWLLGFSFTP